MKHFLNKVIDLLYTDEYYIARTNINSTLSMLMNLTWAISKILVGILTNVYLICVSGFFTLGLGLCKSIYFYVYKKHADTASGILKIAIVLLISSICYGGYMITLFTHYEAPEDYGFIISMIITIIAFFKIYFSFKGLLKMHAHREPFVVTLKGVNFCGALANLVLIQSFLFFILETNLNLKVMSIISGVVGLIVAVISIIISILLIRLSYLTKNGRYVLKD